MNSNNFIEIKINMEHVFLASSHPHIPQPIPFPHTNTGPLSGPPALPTAQCLKDRTQNVGDPQERRTQEGNAGQTPSEQAERPLYCDSRLGSQWNAVRRGLHPRRGPGLSPRFSHNGRLNTSLNLQNLNYVSSESKLNVRPIIHVWQSYGGDKTR